MAAFLWENALPVDQETREVIAAIITCIESGRVWYGVELLKSVAGSTKPVHADLQSIEDGWKRLEKKNS